MQNIAIFLKKKFFPAALTAAFLGSTLFLTSAAAQRLLLTAQTKASVKSSGQAKLVSEGRVGAAEGEPARNNPNQPVVAAQAASVTAALSGLAASGNSGAASGKPPAVQSQLAAASVSVGASSGLGNSGNVFTLAMLAQHNQSGDCYIAYQGKVYDLSQVGAWSNCQHHGVTGGIDVTSLFPHPVSYFNGIPMIGVLASGAGSAQNSGAAAGQVQTTTAAALGSAATTPSREDADSRELEAEHSDSGRTERQTNGSGQEWDD